MATPCRRSILAHAAKMFAAPYVATTWLASAGAARAQSLPWPSRPVRILVGFAPGGSGDTLARILAEKVAGSWGQPVIVENRVGASGTIALDTVARATDGHTFGMLNFAHVVAAELQRLPFSLENDLTPVASIAQQANVLVVSPAIPASSVAELIAHLKRHPGQLSFASGGNGTPGHVAGELFKQQAGVDMLHVAYGGGPPALQDVAAGHVQVMFAPIVPAMALIESGRLRPLAVTSSTRAVAMPNLMSMTEAGIDFDVRDWHGLVVPRGTPASIVERVSADVQRVFGLTDVQERLTSMRAERLVASPAEFQAMVAAETTKWRRVIHEANIVAR